MKNLKYYNITRLNIDLISMLVLCFMLTAFIFSAQAAGDTKQATVKEYVSEGKYFKVNLPADWSQVPDGFGLSAEEKKVYGVSVTGPASEDGISSKIAVNYYAPGNLLHKTMDLYIKRHAQPVLEAAPDGREYGAVKDRLLTGLQAKFFERKVYEYIPPRVINPRKIAIYESFVVIPVKEGFCVLRYTAPEKIAEKYRDIFEKVIGSFEPLIK